MCISTLWNMDGKESRIKAQHDKGEGVKHFIRRNSGRVRRRHRSSLGHTQDGPDGYSQPRSKASQSRCNSEAKCHTESSSNSNCAVTPKENYHRKIPGYYYDPVKNRYFKTSQDHPGRPLLPKSVPEESNNELFKRISPSRLHHFRKREITHIPVVSERRGLEEWARNTVEKKCFPFRHGAVCDVVLSPSCHKMVAVSRTQEIIHCNTILEVYDVNHDKEDFISPKMFATMASKEVSHVEWNPNKNMENVLLASVLGSERSTGSGIICKFNDSSTSCELQEYLLSCGTAWHCSWCQNPEYSHLLGIAGSKETNLVDAEKKISLRQIRSSSDVFCVEFARKTPLIFLGCRSGDILRIDIRVNLKQTCIGKRRHSSMTCIKMMEDENYLMASNYDGMIKMWDVRLSKPVKEYHGNVNETKLIPFVMDSSQSIIASAGQDGKTRIWSVGSCKLLNIIDCPDTNCEKPANVPPVCLGERWGNKGGMVAFGLASNDQLYLYY